MALSNLQQTGSTSGIVHLTLALDPLARRAVGAWRDDGTLEIRADDHLIVFDPRTQRVVEGAPFVRVVVDERARPGNLVTWAVDRARAAPWFGDERLQWLKAVAFTLLDKARQTFSRSPTADEVRGELGIPETVNAPDAPAADPQIGWPPSAIPPPIKPALAGEGRWISLEHDPFITTTADMAAPPFVTTFLRPDAQRPDVRVYVTLWDPRRVALHMQAGTVEPISATGEHGPGLVPRAPEVMTRLVAAFNGGFQAEHGEYGMQADGIEYLPPKPFAATVVELRDGSNAFGAWPDSPVIPDDVVGLRQNLTPLVQNGQFNPWGRTWWGGTPPGWPDQIHSARSALCLTKEGFAGYFYSTSISAQDLAQGMLSARCSFGIHLDMNPGHAGFEFYNVARQGHLPSVASKLQPDWQAEGTVPGMDGYVFRSRRMIRAMGHMLFPRYIQREARDFFYLTTRAILPGAPLASGDGATAARDGAWRTQGLPQFGFPYAVATTTVPAEGPRPEVKLRVLRADPRTLAPSDRASSGAPAVVSFAAPASGSDTLWWSPGAFWIDSASPNVEALPLFAGSRTPLAATRAAVGIQDEDGMLVWVEWPADTKPDASTAHSMDRLLERLGCSSRMFLPAKARLMLGAGTDLAGAAIADPPPSIARLVRATAPDAHLSFEDTPIVPVQTWQPLQARRVRYFPKRPPAASPVGPVSSTPSARPSGTDVLARGSNGR
jgi:hypothetical protein